MTFLEARRNKVTWSIVFFCLVLVLNSFLMQEVTIAAHDRIMRDVGLAAINLFGLLLAIFLGVSTVTREIERRTVYMILARPISRAQYLVGKLFGVWITIAASLGMMMVAFVLEMVVFRAPVAAVLFQAFWLMMMEFLLIASFSILASTFTSSLISAFLSVALFVIGHLASDLHFFGSKSQSPVVRALSAALFYLLPNLEKLNLKTAAALLTPVSAAAIGSATLYALIYVVAFMALSLALFTRKDLK
jgi:ABC-type transport system involved in multi-copper enzyme maturation permease subunit